MASRLREISLAHRLSLLQIKAASRVQTCNMSPEEIAERDRPKSRQERRQIERLRKKGRAISTTKEG